METELLRPASSSCAALWRRVQAAQLELTLDPEFTESCSKAIARFTARGKQIAKNTGIIQATVDSIATIDLLKRPADDAEPQELVELYEELEKHRQAQLEGLVAQYHRIGPLLTQIEEKVVDTNKGRAPQMRSYYRHWERQVFDALNKMVLRALATCREL